MWSLKIEYYPGNVAFASPNCELSDFDKVESISTWKQNLKLFFGTLGDSNYSSIQHHGNFTTRSMAIHYGMKSYTGWARPKGIFDGKSRDYKKLLATVAKRDASTFIERYNH